MYYTLCTVMHFCGMEKLNARNMNGYMFNKIRMMAVACGIAIVSGNICGICDKSGTPSEIGEGVGGAVQQVDPSTYVLKSDLDKIKNTSGNSLFTDDYTRVNEAYINGLGADELKNNVACKQLETEKDNAINNASVEVLKNAPNFNAAVNSLTDEMLQNNAIYKKLKEDNNQFRASDKKKKEDINVGDTIAIKIMYSCEGKIAYTEVAIVEVVGDNGADGNGKIKISAVKNSKMSDVKCNAKGMFNTTFTNVNVTRDYYANKSLTRAIEVILWS